MKSRPSRVGWPAAVGVLVLAVVVGALAWFGGPNPPWPSANPARTSPAPSDFATPFPANPLAAVLPELTPGPAPAASAVSRRVTRLPAGLAGRSDVVVLDPFTGQRLGGGGSSALLPASTMKLLTSFAALDLMDPGTRFHTRVVAPARGRLILVGGGDPLLTVKRTANPGRASLQALAEQTAAALSAQGIGAVSLAYDSSAFAGPAWNPSWTENYRYAVAPVTALVADRGASRPMAARSRNPAKSAASAFARLLAARGITLTGPIRSARAAGAAEVAAVSSLPLDQIIEETLRFSDNDAAEHLLRLVSRAAGGDGSAASGTATVRARLQAHGLWASGVRLVDGSGLSRDDRITPAVLAKVVGAGVSDPRFRPLVTGLPVAGVTGTLWERFEGKAEASGRGVARAKTGTLRDVAALAGYVVTRDGSVLAYAFMANHVIGITRTEAWMDRSVAALARCGCR